jgi:hypothetical protein
VEGHDAERCDETQAVENAEAAVLLAGIPDGHGGLLSSGIGPDVGGPVQLALGTA